VEKIDYQDPLPDWQEVVILWDDVLRGPKYDIAWILHWLNYAPGGRYHLHGYNSTEGFAFRFERPEDATYFILKWL
jgi:hypothetical protein